MIRCLRLLDCLFAWLWQPHGRKLDYQPAYRCHQACDAHCRPEVTLQPSPSTPQTGATMQGMLTAGRNPERGWCPPAGAPSTAPPPHCRLWPMHAPASTHPPASEHLLASPGSQPHVNCTAASLAGAVQHWRSWPWLASVCSSNLQRCSLTPTVCLQT